jgi:hypothetical protein
MAGTWSIVGGYLNQSDETNSNTNIYAPLTQNLSNQYLYHWQGKIEGTGANRRAGFHFFCDDATQTNRGNSYFVWIRPDQGTLEIYEVVSNVFSLVSTAPLSTSINTWYDYKVIYDRISGKMDVYVNNVLVESWTDASPLLNGNAISFRSGNCNYTVNDLKVYRSRLPSVTVSVGAAVTNDVRYQNPDPATPSGRVKSITKDVVGNLSAIASQDVDVDWTIPSDALIDDGTTTDIDTTYSLTQLSANWSNCADPNSGIARYWYAIGTAAGATDVVNWTDNAMSTSVTQTGLSLIINQLYYVSVQSEDGAGLLSNVSSSDGQMVLATGISENGNEAEVVIYPNPVSEEATISYMLKEDAEVEIFMTDILGKRITVQDPRQQTGGKYSYTISKENLNLAEGIYTLVIRMDEIVKVYKLVVN